MAKDEMKALIINCSPVRNGATAEIVKLVSEQLSNWYSVKSICIDDYTFALCRGCRSCHNTAKCVMGDAAIIESIMREYDEADIIVSVSPSYWADIPGQFKSFIDRCQTQMSCSLYLQMPIKMFYAADDPLAFRHIGTGPQSNSVSLLSGLD